MNMPNAPRPARDITEVIKRAEQPVPFAPRQTLERELLKKMDALEVAMDAKRLGDTDMKAIANSIYQLRYGLLVKLAEGIGADPSKLYGWAEQTIESHMPPAPAHEPDDDEPDPTDSAFPVPHHG